MHLQQHHRAGVHVVEASLNVDHRLLHHVGGRPLNRRILRDALPELPHVPVAGTQLGHVAAAPHERLDVPDVLRHLDLGVEEITNTREALEVGGDEVLRLLA